MNNKITVFSAIILIIIIILEPWLLLALEPILIYLFNILACLILLLLIIQSSKKIEKEKAKKEVISLAAHQLSAPLASIKWSLQMLLNNDFDKITEEQREVIERTLKKNDQLIYLVEDLLDVAKIEEGKYLLKREPYNIEKIVLSVASLYQEEIKKKKINFRFEKPKQDLSQINMDKEKIKLVVQNLFDNAVKYTPVGGEITVSLKEGGKNVEFKIQDSGMGIEKNQRKKVFNKFFRGGEAIKKEPMGCGLGLFFVKSIISAHNGRVWFTSKENQGSTFYFRLPIIKK